MFWRLLFSPQHVLTSTQLTWSEVSVIWNEVTIPWNDLTLVWCEMTGSEMTVVEMTGYLTITQVVLIFLFSVDASSIYSRLEPERPLLNQVLHHKETVLFHLVKLVASRSYELRISYPATTPTDFHIHLVSEESIRGRQIRKLLNIDKLVFNNDAAVTEKFANVTAIRIGVPFDPNRLSDPVLYNIVLEELSFGIPHHVWRVVFALALTVFLTVKYLTPKFLSFIDGHLKRDQEKRKS